ncbi:MAG: YtxH domain-containing protein [Streptomycetales bacterium]
MRIKAAFLAGLGVGYVLGARAGRERYEAIRRTSQRLSENPRVQQAAGAVQHRTGRLAGQARRRATERGRQVTGRLGGKVRSQVSGKVSSTLHRYHTNHRMPSHPATGDGHSRR